MNRSCGGWTGIESDLSVRLWPRPSQTVERLVATVFERIPEFDNSYRICSNVRTNIHTNSHKHITAQGTQPAKSFLKP